jgi:hypothetical protein
MPSPLYAITATDDNGNDWYAITRVRFDASGSGDGSSDLYDHYGYAVALMHCATVMEALPAFKWSVKRFAL